MLKRLPFVAMTEGDRLAGGKVEKSSLKLSNFFVSGRIIYTGYFSVANLKKGFVLLFSAHYMREF